MEPIKVEFLFDFGSPNAYLAAQIIPDIERRSGVKFDYVPILLGGIFKLTNNRSPVESLQGVRNKLEFMQLETARFVRRHGITHFRPNPFFPVNTLQLMRGAVAAQFEGMSEPYIRAAYHHMWEAGRSGDCGRGVRQFGDRFRELVEARARGGRQNQIDGIDARRGRSRRVRVADILRRRRNVLRQGSTPRRRGRDRCPEIGAEPGTHRVTAWRPSAAGDRDDQAQSECRRHWRR